MDIKNYFEQRPQMPSVMICDVIDKRSIGEYIRVDVRQPVEYEKGHLPGARLIPLAELASPAGRARFQETDDRVLTVGKPRSVGCW
jgi:rhodanese-related sulfurtransferase